MTNNSTQEIIEIIISEYEKSQKNIQPIWLGEGWYKGSPNSFNYFASGFEAGMEFSRRITNERVY